MTNTSDYGRLFVEGSRSDRCPQYVAKRLRCRGCGGDELFIHGGVGHDLAGLRVYAISAKVSEELVAYDRLREVMDEAVRVWQSEQGA